MLIFKHRLQLEAHILNIKPDTLGFVPTMGALHKGHLSLIQTSKNTCSITVSSIYVNPTQFNSLTDYQKYPYVPEKDIALLSDAGCDILYLPDTKDIYGEMLPENEHYDIGFLETTLEGAFRPKHYQGVCMVVKRLLEAVKPDKMFLGLKDYQQVMVLKRLTELLQIKVEIVGCPTLREDNGLAMSSRNLRLIPEQRQIAAIIFDTLKYVKVHYGHASITELCAEGTNRINSIQGMRVEYFDIRNADTLKQLQSPNEVAIALTAVFCGDVRLIDNLRLN